MAVKGKSDRPPKSSQTYNPLCGNMNKYEEDLCLGFESRLVEPIRHDVKDTGEDAHVVARIEGIGNDSVFVDIEKHLLEQLQP